MGTLSLYKGFTVNFLCGRPSGLRPPSGTCSGRQIATTKAVLYIECPPFLEKGRGGGGLKHRCAHLFPFLFFPS